MRSKSATGSSSIELPLCLFLLFILFVFPLIDIAATGLRVTTIFSAAREAARAAGRSRSFLVDTPDGQSATNIAKQVATSQAGHVAHIIPADVKVVIVGTPIKSGMSAIRQSTVLAAVSPKDYVYQLEVEVTGSVDPLVTLDRNLFGAVPGLTVPITFTARNSEVAEFPLGLDK